MLMFHLGGNRHPVPGIDGDDLYQALGQQAISKQLLCLSIGVFGDALAGNQGHLIGQRQDGALTPIEQRRLAPACQRPQTLGLLLLSSWMVQRGINEGSLQRVLPGWQASPYESRNDEIHAVFRGGRFLKPQARAFIDFLAERIPALQDGAP